MDQSRWHAVCDLGCVMVGIVERGWRWVVRLGCVSCAYLAASCYPVSELQRPRVVAPGDVRIAVGTRWQSVGPHGGPGIPYSPASDVALRIGVARGVDVGVRHTIAALEAGAKVQLHDTPELAVAIAPAVMLATDADNVPRSGGPHVRGDAMGIVRVPVFIGTRIGDHVEPWIAPSLHTGMYLSDAADPLLAIACVMGVDLILSRSMTVQPQIGALVTVAGPGPIDGESRRLGRGDYRFTAALNVFLHR